MPTCPVFAGPVTYFDFTFRKTLVITISDLTKETLIKQSAHKHNSDTDNHGIGECYIAIYLNCISSHRIYDSHSCQCLQQHYAT